MEEKYQNMLDSLDIFLKSPEGKAYMQEVADAAERKVVRAQRAHNILEKMTYEQRLELIQRIGTKHDERWEKLCYSRGFEPYPWNVVYPIFSAADQFGAEYDYDQGPLDDFDAHFGAYTMEYMGFYFNTIHGQGTVIRIFDKDKKEIFRS